MVTQDPFDYRTISPKLLGQERLLGDLIKLIDEGSRWILIYGVTGCGKSALGKHIKERIDKDKNTLTMFIKGDKLKGLDNISFEDTYYTPEVQKFYKIPFFSNFIKPRGKLKPNHKAVLFVDEFHAVHTNLAYQIKAAYDDRLFDSVVTIQIEKQLQKNFPKPIHSRITNFVTPSELDEHQLKQMVKDRADLFEDEALSFIIKGCGKIPRDVLIACSNCRRKISKELGEKITLDEVKSIKDLFNTNGPRDNEIELTESNKTEDEIKTKQDSTLPWYNVGKNLAPLQKDILKLMVTKDDTPVTIVEICEKTRKRNTTISSQLSKLTKLKLIEKVDTKRPSRYALTRETLRKLTPD